MKKLSMLFLTVMLLTANAESMRMNESLATWTARRIQENAPRFDERRPNEIKVGPLTYSGIAIEVVRVDNPLHMINPAAPVQYGFAEPNVVRDPIAGRVSGLKIFSIQF